MKILWLGQGGLLFVSEKKKILVDPYLSNSLKKVDKSLARRIRINKKLFRVRPDIIVLTNSHPDHTDIKTLSKYLGRGKRNKITVLCSESAFNLMNDVKDCAKGNRIMFSEGDEWTLDYLRIRGVKAKTDDKSAFGIIITDSKESKSYYVASNTLYNEQVIEAIPKDSLFASFIPVSGTNSCMNMDDAIRFARKINAEYSIPFHYGMFDKIDPDKFVVPGKLIPRPYRAIEFNILPIQPLFAPRVFDRRFNEKKIKSKEKALDSTLDLSSEEKIEETTMRINAITDDYLKRLEQDSSKSRKKPEQVVENTSDAVDAEEEAFVSSEDIDLEDTTYNTATVSSPTPSVGNDPYIVTMDTEEKDYTSSYVTKELQKISSKDKNEDTYSETDELEKIDEFLERLEKRERGEDTNY